MKGLSLFFVRFPRWGWGRKYTPCAAIARCGGWNHPTRVLYCRVMAGLIATVFFSLGRWRRPIHSGSLGLTTCHSDILNMKYITVLHILEIRNTDTYIIEITAASRRAECHRTLLCSTGARRRRTTTGTASWSARSCRRTPRRRPSSSARWRGGTRRTRRSGRHGSSRPSCVSNSRRAE